MEAFDTEQRLALLRRFVARLVSTPRAGPKPLVIDVGGYPGLLAAGLEATHRVVTVDTVGGAPPRDYAVASGCALPFRDAAFRAAVASDVLEHVPAARREAFLTETCRVARGGWVLVGAPFRSPAVAQAEASLNELHRLVRGRPNPWLEEHWQCGLPDLAETREVLRRQGLASVVVPNGSLLSWLLLKGVEEILYAVPDAFRLFAGINDTYLNFWAEGDHQRPTYRHLILAHPDPECVAALIQVPPPNCGLEYFGPDTDAPPGGEGDAPRIRALASQFEAIAGVLLARASAPETLETGYGARLEAIVDAQEKQMQRQEKQLQYLRSQLARLEGNWLARLGRRLLSRARPQLPGGKQS